MKRKQICEENFGQKEAKWMLFFLCTIVKETLTFNLCKSDICQSLCMYSHININIFVFVN